MKELVAKSKEELVSLMWESAPRIYSILRNADDLTTARENLYKYLNRLERHYFNIFSERSYKDMHILIKNIAKESIRVLKNVIRSENEKLTRFSALKRLYNIAHGNTRSLNRTSEGFLCEFIVLFRGIAGKSELPEDIYEHVQIKEERRGAVKRSRRLDIYSRQMTDYIRDNYITGLDEHVISAREELKHDILAYFKGRKSDWYNYNWHMKHIIKDVETLASLIKLEDDEIEGLVLAKRFRIPFHVTPYYLSLFNKSGRTVHDRSVRAQVLPAPEYCRSIEKERIEGVDLDFMQEKSTSPINCITRRYPQIVILKPYDACPQICVYCQRNWEIKSIDKAKITRKEIKNAIGWIRDNDTITEVLITGGDPLTLKNNFLNSIIGEVAEIDHVSRIRIGTRVLVTLPYRINDGFLNILKTYHEWGKRELCIITHFEYPSELTPDSLEAIRKIKDLGINIYNQQVFTYFNSRKYMTCHLRKVLKLAGVDPYYTFNTQQDIQVLSMGGKTENNQRLSLYGRVYL